MLIKLAPASIFVLPGQRPNWRFSQWAAQTGKRRKYAHNSFVCMNPPSPIPSPFFLPCVCLSLFVGLNLTSTIWRCKHAALTHFATHCVYVTLTFLYRYPHKCTIYIYIYVVYINKFEAIIVKQNHVRQQKVTKRKILCIFDTLISDLMMSELPT